MSDDEEEVEQVYITDVPIALDLPACVEKVEFRSQPIEILLTGEVSSDMAAEFDRSFRRALASGQKDLVVVIHSDGGCVYSGLKICDTILMAPDDVRVHTVCRGSAMSAAAMIFCCGQQRVMSPNACLMIHSVSTSIFEGKTGDLQVESKELNRLTETMCRVMANNTGVPIKFFRSRMEKNVDAYLSPEEALKVGLVTDIGDLRFQTTVEVTTTMEMVRPKKRRRV